MLTSRRLRPATRLTFEKPWARSPATTACVAGFCTRVQPSVPFGAGRSSVLSARRQAAATMTVLLALFGNWACALGRITGRCGTTSAPRGGGAAGVAGDAVAAGHPGPAGSVEDIPRLVTAKGGVGAVGDGMPEAVWTIDVRDVPAGEARCGDAVNVVSADAERLVRHKRTVAAGSDRKRVRRSGRGASTRRALGPARDRIG